jgi:curved DNA-binding protein CbpA
VFRSPAADPSRMPAITEAHSVLRSKTTRARYDSFIARLPAAARPVYGESRVGMAETLVLTMAFITVCQYIFMWVRFTERRSAVLEAGDLQQAIHDIKRQGGPEMNDA